MYIMMVQSPEIFRWFLFWSSLVLQPPSLESAHTSSDHTDKQLTEASPGGNAADELKTNSAHTSTRYKQTATISWDSQRGLACDKQLVADCVVKINTCHGLQTKTLLYGPLRKVAGGGQQGNNQHVSYTFLENETMKLHLASQQKTLYQG